MADKCSVAVDQDGDRFRRINNKLHRLDGPAVESFNDDRLWYLNGKLHREGGPAIVYSSKEESWAFWYLNGLVFSEEEHARIVKNG